VKIRRIVIRRFRGLEAFELCPNATTLLIGPNNAGKSTVLEALDLLLHPGWGRPRPQPTELDYYRRNPDAGFEIEAVLGDLSAAFAAETHQYLEGWRAETKEVIADPDGDGAEPIVRVRVTGSSDFDLQHEFAKPEAEGSRFGPAVRRQVGWLFDGRTRDPAWHMTFHQGGVLERLFSEADLLPGLNHLREALGEGADRINADGAFLGGLKSLGEELVNLHLLDEGQLPGFELGSVSQRELLLTLRLALPVLPELMIPLVRQGRGAQRLLLVAALLRLVNAENDLAPIAAFEEPEEALEPMRQTQIAAMITQVSDRGGQVFVVSHSPEVVRAFSLDDLVLVADHPRGEPKPLSMALSEASKQGYERRLDGPVVRALFARVPLLVEGPGDRAVFGVFWDHLADQRKVEPRYARSLEPVNCEGADHQRAVARLLCEAGKPVAAWVERDRPETLVDLRAGGHCSALVIYPDEESRQKLEAALAQVCSLAALADGMTAMAAARDYTWEQQRDDLCSRASEDLEEEDRAALREANSVLEALQALPEEKARQLVLVALTAKDPKPFEMKGARPARLLAEAVVRIDGVPSTFAKSFIELDDWIAGGCAGKREIVMPG
jgi:putative ATP-dependent endonuclease of the OLD family